VISIKIDTLAKNVRGGSVPENIWDLFKVNNY
jgi:hypothetical protein